MPRPTTPSIYDGHCSKRPREDTMFALWLKAHGVSKNKAARLVGCAPRMIEWWCQGRSLPGLVFALKIEQITEGGVGVEMWLGTSIGKHQWAELQKKCVAKEAP